MTPETQLRLQEIRQKSLCNTATVEELREAMTIMRGDRAKAAAVSSKSKTTKAAKAKPIDSDDLLSELDN